jgi:hypothetical protein
MAYSWHLALNDFVCLFVFWVLKWPMTLFYKQYDTNESNHCDIEKY